MAFTNSKHQGISRRSFITGAGAAALGGATAAASSAAAASAGEAVQQPQEAEEAEQPGFPELDEDAEHESFDVVVIGGGTSGTCAALAAAQAGAKTVVVEKTGSTGGLSNYSTFIFGAQTSLQKEAGYDITADELYLEQRSYYKGTCYLPLVRNIYDNSGETIEWLARNGLGLIAFPQGLTLQSALPRAQEQCAHMMTGATREPVSDDVTLGNFAGLYATYLEDYGGQLMLNTRAFKLVPDEDGEGVAGVACVRDDGTQVILDAKAVVVATYAWSGDTEHFREQIAHDPIYNQQAESADTGDGIVMAKKVGAQPWISTPCWHQAYLSNPDGSENYSLICRETTIVNRLPVFLWLSPDGERFCDETTAGDFAYFANTAYSQGGSYWIVMDSATLADLEANGSPVPNLGGAPGDSTARTGTESISAAVGEYTGPMTGITSLFEGYVDEGVFIKADTLDGLAEATGMDEEAMEASIAAYNEAVDTGEDPAFLKDARYLCYKVESGPFYAIRMTVNSEGGSLGGLRVNKDLKMYRRSTGKPFRNLYAAGMAASGFFGLGAYVDICGSTMGFAVNSGRLAGQGAAAVALGVGGR